MREPLLPVFPPTKQEAIHIASALTAQLVRGKTLNAPIGKYAIAICKVFDMPLAPGEDAMKISFDKLIEWRHAISFNVVRPKEFEVLIPQLIEIYGRTEELGIRGAIASEVQTRNDRKAANKYRKPREEYRRRENTAAPLYLPENPFND